MSVPTPEGAERWPISAAILFGAALLGLAAAPHLPVLLWNATASAPLGFYRLAAEGEPRVGDLVAYRPPPPLADWLDRGGYAPFGVPLLKRVAAAAGQEVCRRDEEVSVDRRVAARARLRDARGAVLPRWAGCRRLGPGEVFLLNAPQDSLDGRYFGVSHTADVLGRAEPLWTWGATP